MGTKEEDEQQDATSKVVFESTVVSLIFHGWHQKRGTESFRHKREGTPFSRTP